MSLFPDTVASAPVVLKKIEKRYGGLVVSNTGETISYIHGADQLKVMTDHKAVIDRMRRHGRKDVFVLFGEMQKI